MTNNINDSARDWLSGFSFAQTEAEAADWHSLLAFIEAQKAKEQGN